jgi:hypothetical protein
VCVERWFLQYFLFVNGVLVLCSECGPVVRRTRAFFPSVVHSLKGFLNRREQHIESKIQSMVKEAKAKMAKGDKKGTLLMFLSLDLLLSWRIFLL